jgi:L-ascorbate metabolism protein UlaG (beta-lactamase superfamily)
MEITWYGHSCFRMVERGVATIVTDPYYETIGYAPLKLKADIVTVSHDAPGHAAHANVEYGHLLYTPGEFEIGGVFIMGLATYDVTKGDTARRNIIYTYAYNGLMVCHLGDLDFVPDQSTVETLGPIDVLLVPVGGGNALNSSQAAEVISLIEPGIVIPMHYHTPASQVSLDGLDKFIKEMGLAHIEPVDSLKVTGSSATEQTQVVVFNYEH